MYIYHVYPKNHRIVSTILKTHKLNIHNKVNIFLLILVVSTNDDDDDNDVVAYKFILGKILNFVVWSCCVFNCRNFCFSSQAATVSKDISEFLFLRENKYFGINTMTLLKGSLCEC